jgi:hypothetical protein
VYDAVFSTLTNFCLFVRPRPILYAAAIACDQYSAKRQMLLAEAEALHAKDQLWTNLNDKEYPSLPSVTAGAAPAPVLVPGNDAAPEVPVENDEDNAELWEPLLAETDAEIEAADVAMAKEVANGELQAPADAAEQNTILPPSFTEKVVWENIPEKRQRKLSAKGADLLASKK